MCWHWNLTFLNVDAHAAMRWHWDVTDASVTTWQHWTMACKLTGMCTMLCGSAGMQKAREHALFSGPLEAEGQTWQVDRCTVLPWNGVVTQQAGKWVMAGTWEGMFVLPHCGAGHGRQAVLPHHEAGTKQAWKQVCPHGCLESRDTPILHGNWYSHAVTWWHWDTEGPQKLCLCCRMVVLGHSVGRYSCFCVVRRRYWILKAFK